MIREQHIKSGKYLEVKFYPLFADGTPVPRGPKKKVSTKAQSEYNKRQSVKHMIRLILANFDERDLLMHPTYDPTQAPMTLEQAKRDIANYIRRIKTLRRTLQKQLERSLKTDPHNEALKERRRLLRRPFKYAYGIEVVEYKSGPYKGRCNYHFHLFMTGWGGNDRDAAEAAWTKGMRSNCNRFRPKVFGPEAAARYVAKAPAGSRRFSCSKNMDKPVEEAPKDGEVSALDVERMVKRHAEDRHYWERRHRGYEFLGFEKPPSECYNEYNGYYYLTVKFYRKEPEKRKRKR